MIPNKDIQIEVLASIYDMFIHSLQMQLDNLYNFNNEYRDANKKKFITEGSYHFIPCRTRIALESFVIAKMYFGMCDNITRIRNSMGSISFLDAGCGVGNILVLAQHLGFNVFGLELDDNVIKVAKKHIFGNMLNPVNMNFIRPEYLEFITYKGKKYPIAKQNILEYEGYGWYDIIYYYCPFENADMEYEFEKRVEDQMKVGAILMPQLKRGTNISRDKRFVPLSKKMGFTNRKKYGRIFDHTREMFVKIKE